MSEEITEQRLHELRELGKSHSKAKGQLTLLEYSRPILKAKLMKEHMISSNSGKLESVNAQEREALADPKYEIHIKGLSKAVENENDLAWQKEVIRMRFETWKTKMINQFKEAKDYGIKK